ncbi:hypothetical protein H6G74_08710 [Nostoc spongiaeforme FACHB-130]|uniref:Uncharacterized protein n=1 Tax=Nostoc spongiaeforme FACHB-130 TaxID=1357510 RepID=A0ABR8FT29_9NOSO|nr:hypothetical protein [Nostoc spongiaeforme]MBD2594411.1 hypothetical protein [Nostoc spongiaeforme FACHB-130]
MENRQNFNHEPTQLIEPNLELPKTKLGSKGRSNMLMALLTQHPLVLLCGVFTMFVGTAAVAFYSLSHVDHTKQAESEPIPVIVEEPITIEHSNPLPLWMVMAIALSCGSGCYLIFRLFNPSQAQKLPKSTSSRPQALKPISQTSRKLPVFAPLQPLKVKSKTLVEVLPSAQQYRLGKGKESLADLMDIRKENSLSALLQKH